MAKFVCPECHKQELTDHCAQCNWLRCGYCLITIGPTNTIFTKDKAKKRRNGV